MYSSIDEYICSTSRLGVTLHGGEMYSSIDEYIASAVRLVYELHYRVAKTHRMPYLYMSFSQKSPKISGSFAKNDLQLNAFYDSSPSCTMRCIYVHITFMCTSHLWITYMYTFMSTLHLQYVLLRSYITMSYIYSCITFMHTSLLWVTYMFTFVSTLHLQFVLYRSYISMNYIH